MFENTSVSWRCSFGQVENRLDNAAGKLRVKTDNFPLPVRKWRSCIFFSEISCVRNLSPGTCDLVFKIMPQKTFSETWNYYAQWPRRIKILVPSHKEKLFREKIAELGECRFDNPVKRFHFRDRKLSFNVQKLKTIFARKLLKTFFRTFSMHSWKTGGRNFTKGLN